ncbi:MAG: hypothetical protein IH988_07535 [Planctomycetes bacterium]|nr:hypothetical protein [Planctomycetota bacterium]
MPRAIHFVVVTTGLAVFMLAVVWPMIALIRGLIEAPIPSPGYLQNVRPWALLGRTLLLAGGATALSLFFSLPGAFAIGSIGRVQRAPVLGAILLLPLLCPPMVYAFGWQGVLDRTEYVGTSLHCILVWASWSWPIPAMLIGSGWSRKGRSAYEAALLVASPASAFLRVALPVLARYVAVAVMMLLALFAGEYSVPHACGLVVYSTELLGWASSSNAIGDVVLPAVPMAGTILFLLVFVAWVGRDFQSDRDSEDEPGVDARPSRGLFALVATVTLITAVVPIGSLAGKMDSWAVLGQALDTYYVELLQSLAVAVATGIGVVLLGCAVVAHRPLRVAGMILTLLYGLLPGALIGEIVVLAYRDIPIVYYEWPLVVIGLTARFAWLGVLVAWLAWAAGARELSDQARVDGASEPMVATRIRLAAHLPALAAGGVVVAVLALAEIATASLVRVPSVGLISLILIEKFHRLEDGMLAALSFWLVIPAVAAALLAGIALHPWSLGIRQDSTTGRAR